MSNMDLTAELLRALWSRGVREVVVCAGARNAPLVSVLSQQKSFRVHSFFEERSAGFFALGRMLARPGHPVAVVTTSGTAAAELLPAMIEADYQALPLIALTADRPRRYRGSGAPQTINQVGIYSHYVEKTWDIEGRVQESFEWSSKRPVHVNVCFDEPLIDGPLPQLDFTDEAVLPPSASTRIGHVCLSMRRPLIIAGGLPRAQRLDVLAHLRAWRRPVYAESPSNLRGMLGEFEVLGGEKALRALEYDGVIRIGSVPTLRLWRDLETREVPVVHFSQTPFSGLPREPRVFSLESLFHAQFDFEPWSARDISLAEKRDELLRQFPWSEPGWVQWLSQQMPPEARVFLGNSLPIREWDFAALPSMGHEIFANRGVNGIDGLISTFLGLADAEKSNWCVLGDLSALYDLSGPWANRGLGLRDVNLVIINNGGGKIFHRMFHNSLFENNHDLNFKAWAEMWGWEYLRPDHPLRGLPKAGRPRVIEIIPDAGQTEAFWNSWEVVK